MDLMFTLILPFLIGSTTGRPTMPHASSVPELLAALRYSRATG
jgi:hypothetical protein